MSIVFIVAAPFVFSVPPLARRNYFQVGVVDVDVLSEHEFKHEDWNRFAQTFGLAVSGLAS